MGLKPSWLKPVMDRFVDDSPEGATAAAIPNAGDTNTAPEGSEVWLHVYNTDPVSGFLNRKVLKRQECPIYHVAVEIYGNEWCFQYFEDTWNDPDYSGVFRCKPKQMRGYDYQFSLCLGPTTLDEAAVQKILYVSTSEWPACSYHLTHHNCINYAEELVKKLNPREPFPQFLKTILTACNRNWALDGVVDSIWNCIKWFQIRKHQSPEERTAICSRGCCLALGVITASAGAVWLIVKDLVLLPVQCLLVAGVGGGCCLCALKRKADGPSMLPKPD